MTIGENIKRIRKEKKLSQQKLGEKLGVSQAMIAQYETGKRIPKLETITKIAESLNVSRNTLLDNTSSSEKSKIVKLGIGEMLKNLHIEVDKIEDAEEITFKALEQRSRYLKLYDKLNTIGQEKAIERVEELTEIPRYTHQDEPQE